MTMNIIICEDDEDFQDDLTKVISNYLLIQNYDAILTKISKSPAQILKCITEKQILGGLYFLDIVLGDAENGITLATKIREQDKLAKIVFVTWHTELMYLTFTYKVEALDFIPKDLGNTFQTRLLDCLDVAYQRYLTTSLRNQCLITIRNDTGKIRLNLDEIMFIESSVIAHRLIAHLEKQQVEFYGEIKEVEKLSGLLIRCHQSYVVNVSNIRLLNKRRRELIMKNGEKCFVSTRYLKRVGDLF
ncbi:LytTR family DNA-binding domain-containing protein [Pediococcus acidilactici]